MLAVLPHSESTIMTVPTLEAVNNVEDELHLTNKCYSTLISICVADTIILAHHSNAHELLSSLGLLW